MKPILFYDDEYYLLSNFSSHQVEYKGEIYPTAEHAYQAQKFTDRQLQEQVRYARSPLLAKDMAYKYKSQWRSDWQEIKVEVMTGVVLAKLKQHEEVRQALKKTGTAEIKENSPVDYFWGIGKDGSGQNQMGKIWMKLRDEIKQDNCVKIG